MGAFADYLATGGDVVPAPADTSPGQFRQGLRSGLSGAYSQLEAAAGGVAEAAGMPGVAADRFAAARGAQADAQAQAPRVTSYKDVHDLRSGFDYVTGVIGQSIPQSAAMIGGGLMGRTPVGRAVAATGAGVPFEAGDIVQRQQNDPTSMLAPAGERAAHAFGGGVASAGAQSVLPAVVAGKVAGPAAGAAQRTVGQAVAQGAKDLVPAMALEGVSEGTGEALKQGAVMLSNPARTLDTEAIKEGVVGGMAAGGAMHGVGAAADVAHAAVRSPGNTLSGVVDRARTALAPDGAPPAAAAAQGPKADMPDPVEAIRGIYDEGMTSARAFWDRVSSREDVADLRAVAGKTAEQVKAALPAMDGERLQKVGQAAQDLMDRAGLDDGRRAQLQAAMGDLTDRGNQAIVAGLKKGSEATQEFGSKAKALMEAFTAKVSAATGAKKSEDFSGIRQAIAQQLVPVLQKSNPDIFTDGPALAQAADGVRMAIEHFKNGGKEQLTSTQIARLIDTFGDEAVNVLDATYRAVNGDQVPADERERFYGALNEMRAQQQEQDKTLGLMMRSLLPELQETIKTPELRRELQVLRDAVTRLDTNTQRGKFQWETLKFDLDTRYGKKADAILEAVEKETKPKENVLAKEDTAELGERELAALGDAIFYGPEKGGLALNPDLDPAGDKGQAKQAMARAQKQNPDRTVRFLSADEIGHDHPDVQNKLKELQAGFIEAGKTADEAMKLAKEAVKSYGMVAAEGSRDAGQITKDNVKSVRVKDGDDKAKTSHYRQPSVFKADNASYDAIMLTKLMEQQFKGERNATDEKSAVHRNARMFMAGVAALQDHLGKAFPLPDTLVIDHLGTTVADVKKLGFTPPNAATDVLEKKLDALRKELKAGGDREAILARAQDLIDEAKAFDPRMDMKDLTTEGEPDVDPLGNVHAALKGRDDPKVQAEVARTRERAKGETGGGALPSDEETAAKSGPVKGTSDVLREKFEAWVKNPPSAAAKTVAERAIKLLDHKELLRGPDKKGLAALLSKGTKPSDVAGTVTALWTKYGERIEGAAAAQDKASKYDAGAIDKMVDREDYASLNTKGKVDDFLAAAAQRLATLQTSEDLSEADDLARFKLRDFFRASHDLGYMYDGVDDGSMTDAQVRKMLADAAPEVAALVLPKGKRSLQSGTGGAGVDAKTRAEIRAYITKVLGPTVKTALANIPHAGEYVRDTVRISVHALNPKSVAYHEALHGFFEKLMGQGNSDVARVMERAAMSAPVQNQLKKLLQGETAALAQLQDPEEAAAYMYQFWAAGQLQVGTRVGDFFERLKQAIGRVLGVITNDQRAEAIMIYFHSGEFATSGLGKPDAVAKRLMDTGRNALLEKAKGFTKPLAEVADALTTAGGQRLRDTGVPALRELADVMKVTGRESAKDFGFMPAWRTERTRIMNEFGAKMRGVAQEHLDDALQAMQSGKGPAAATTAEGRLAAREIAALLKDSLEYMRAAGVDVSKIAPNANYFPRVYDAHRISKARAQFEAVLIRNGVDVKEAERITQHLMTTDGSEISIETDRPGMQNLKHRSLGFIPDAELAPFMRKNLFEIMGSYVTQATRRAEWARRLGDDGSGVAAMLARAKRQGATEGQIDTARKFVRAVDGTLGDDISPHARRVMGNMIVYQNLRLLPLAIFSSVVDPMGIVVRGGTVSEAWDTFKRGMKEIPAAFKGTYGQDADTQLAETLGVIDNAVLASITGQLYTQGLVGDRARKINDAFFRFNLMEGFNRSMRVGATQAAIKFLERHRDGKASKHSERWLAELGLQPGFKMDLNDPAVRAAINLWVDGAVLRPDATDKPIWMSDPHWMLIAHLKQFVYSFQETILKRVAHEYRAGNYTPAMALTAYVPFMIAADAIKSLVQGGGELPEWKKAWGPSDYLGAGIERAGVLGKFQFPLDGPGMMMGPTAQQAYGLVSAIDGKASASNVAVKALPGNPLYAGWLGPDAAAVEVPQN